MRRVVQALLRVFGWVPIPGFALKYILRCLPKRSRESIVVDFLEAVEVEGAMPELVQLVLDMLEKKGYDAEEGRKFDSVKEEVEQAMEAIPQLKPYRVHFERWCGRKRQEVGLS